MTTVNETSEPRLHAPAVLQKSPTGIKGLDSITKGGFPSLRTTLLCGGAGCGKTLMALEFLLRGVIDFGEAGVLVTFEETEEDLAKNVSSLGYDLKSLVCEGRLFVDHIETPGGPFEEVGDYDLEGLFVRLAYAIDVVGAKRIVLDTLETLFAGIPNQSLLRNELRRLFQWFKTKQVTAVITAERGQGTLTRFGLEEYVSDCVIFLDHRVESGISTRRLRIVKYRGSTHGTNEYPFLIDDQGISVVPITGIGLNHEASSDRVPSGIDQLDEMLGGHGYYRGSSILISGMAGTGKTTIAAHFADAACRRDERVVYFGFEESFSQFQRNMQSVGLDFRRWADERLFYYEAARPTLQGLEARLMAMYRMVERIKPHAVVVDPISTFLGNGSNQDVKSMLMRLIDQFKSLSITCVFASLLHDENQLETTDVGVSSLMDTWLLLRMFESNSERNRGIYVFKSRGMSHSNKVREYKITSKGVELCDVYIGPSGVLTGSAKELQEERDRERRQILKREAERRKKALELRRRALDAQISALEAEFEAETEAALGEDTLATRLLYEETKRRAETGWVRTQSAGYAPPIAPN